MDPYRALLDHLGIEHNIPPDQDVTIIEPWHLIEDSPCEMHCWDFPIMLPDEEYIEEEEEEEFYWQEPEYHLDYDQEMHNSMNFKKKHRYSRKDRFRLTLYQLLGMSGEVPPWVIKIIKSELGVRVKKQKIWNEIRFILKKHKLRRYYNRIPSLIKNISGLKPLEINSEKVTKILDNFFLFDYHFNQTLCQEWKRKYFPNLRFIALKLVEEMGIRYPYHVPLIRTSRKKKYLETLFVDFKRTCCML
jgi:hypothetical protein